MTEYCNDDANTCHHGCIPFTCELCDEVGLAHAAGWTQGYEYALLADCEKLPRWLHCLVGRYVPGLKTPKDDR